MVLFKRAKRARFESEKDKASEDVVREEGRALRLRAWYARFFSRVFSGRVDRDTHTPEREKDSYFFLGLCTDYIPLSCLYREVKSKTCRLNFCRRKGVLGTKVLVEVLPSLVTSSV